MHMLCLCGVSRRPGKEPDSPPVLPKGRTQGDEVRTPSHDLCVPNIPSHDAYQTWTVPSSLAETKRFPSGDQATALARLADVLA